MSECRESHLNLLPDLGLRLTKRGAKTCPPRLSSQDSHPTFPPLPFSILLLFLFPFAILLLPPPPFSIPLLPLFPISILLLPLLPFSSTLLSIHPSIYSYGHPSTNMAIWLSLYRYGHNIAIWPFIYPYGNPSPHMGTHYLLWLASVALNTTIGFAVYISQMY